MTLSRAMSDGDQQTHRKILDISNQDVVLDLMERYGQDVGAKSDQHNAEVSAKVPETLVRTFARMDLCTPVNTAHTIQCWAGFDDYHQSGFEYTMV